MVLVAVSGPLSGGLPLRDILDIGWSLRGFSQIKERACTQPEWSFKPAAEDSAWPASMSLATWDYQALEGDLSIPTRLERDREPGGVGAPHLRP